MAVVGLCNDYADKRQVMEVESQQAVATDRGGEHVGVGTGLGVCLAVPSIAFSIANGVEQSCLILANDCEMESEETVALVYRLYVVYIVTRRGVGGTIPGVLFAFGDADFSRVRIVYGQVQHVDTRATLSGQVLV